MDISKLLQAGGIVMIPLISFSILAIALIIERILFWIKLNTRQRKVVQEALTFYRRDNLVSTM